VSSAVSRGSLLRALGAKPCEGAESLVADALGFEMASVNTPHVANELSTPTAVATESDEIALSPNSTRRQQRLWVITGKYDRKPVMPVSGSPSSGTVVPIDSLPPPLPYLPAWPPGRVFNACQDLLQQHIAGNKINVKKATEQVSRWNLFDDLPRKQRPSLSSEVLVLLDRSSHLRPLWKDQIWILQQLDAILGNTAVSCFQSYMGPRGPWRDENHNNLGQSRIRRASQVLLISDFGSLAGGDIATQWRRYNNDLSQLSPSIKLLGLTSVEHSAWPMRTLTAKSTGKVSLLLAALSQAPWAEPAQVRSLRLAVGGSATDELAVYNSAKVNRQGGFINLKETELRKQLEQFASLPEPIRHNIASVIDSWQQYLPESWREVEWLQRNLLNHPHPDNVPLLKRLAECAGAEAAAGIFGSGSTLMASVLPLANSVADNTEGDEWQEWLEQMTVLARGLGKRLPLVDLRSTQSSDYRYIKQLGGRLIVRQNSSGGDLMSVNEHAVCLETRRLLGHAELPLEGIVRIIDDANEYQLQKLARPDWADRYWVDEKGLMHAAHQDGLAFRLTPSDNVQNKFRWQLDSALNGHWGSAAGVDDYGLWADLTADGVSQRMRWIVSGSFQMGSPENEDGRFDNEKLHTVTLSSGYWLAEISCTEAFWNAVQSGNYTSADNPEYPKVNVSWEDCQIWLEKLNNQFPGFNARLPTEAQWEYACRAGTTTAFWWGDDFDEKYANNSAPRSEADYPANNRGLKSMSGNIFEWCRDWYGHYDTGDEIDPQGPVDGQSRVLRGGGWFRDERNMRSAYRYHFTADSRFGDIGLRLAGGADPEAIAGREWATTADRAQRSSDQRGGHGTRPGRD